jgi:hypothetical protein
VQDDQRAPAVKGVQNRLYRRVREVLPAGVGFQQRPSACSTSQAQVISASAPSMPGSGSEARKANRSGYCHYARAELVDAAGQMPRRGVITEVDSGR